MKGSVSRLCYRCIFIYLRVYEISRIHGFCKAVFPLKYGFIIVQVKHFIENSTITTTCNIYVLYYV